MESSNTVARPTNRPTTEKRSPREEIVSGVTNACARRPDAVANPKAMAARRVSLIVTPGICPTGLGSSHDSRAVLRRQLPHRVGVAERGPRADGLFQQCTRGDRLHHSGM